MQMPTQVLGAEGEEIACNYLRSRNFDIRERNVRLGRFELDIVAYDQAEKMIVFVEVKTRTRSSESYPIHTAVDSRKRRSIREATYRWIVAHNYDGRARIDVVTVSGNRIVKHLMNIGSDFY
jgi:putative endonuclease